MISHNSTPSDSLHCCCIAVSNSKSMSNRCTNRKSKSSRRSSSMESSSNHSNRMRYSNRKDKNIVALNSSMDLEKWAIGWLRFGH